MKFRVIDLTSGEEVISHEKQEFFLDQEGRVMVLDWSTGKLSNPIELFAGCEGYITEFAFMVDSENEWIYEHSIVNDIFLQEILDTL